MANYASAVSKLTFLMITRWICLGVEISDMPYLFDK